MATGWRRTVCPARLSSPAFTAESDAARTVTCDRTGSGGAESVRSTSVGALASAASFDGLLDTTLSRAHAGAGVPTVTARADTTATATRTARRRSTVGRLMPRRRPALDAGSRPGYNCTPSPAVRSLWGAGAGTQ